MLPEPIPHVEQKQDDPLDEEGSWAEEAEDEPTIYERVCFSLFGFAHVCPSVLLTIVCVCTVHLGPFNCQEPTRKRCKPGSQPHGCDKDVGYGGLGVSKV